MYLTYLIRCLAYLGLISLIINVGHDMTGLSGHELSTVQDSVRNKMDGTVHCGCGSPITPSCKPCKAKALQLAPKRWNQPSADSPEWSAWWSQLSYSHPFVAIPAHLTFDERARAAESGELFAVLREEMHKLFTAEPLYELHPAVRGEASKLLALQTLRQAELRSGSPASSSSSSSGHGAVALSASCRVGAFRASSSSAALTDPSTLAAQMSLQYLIDAGQDPLSSLLFWSVLDRVISRPLFRPLSLDANPADQLYYSHIATLCIEFCENRTKQPLSPPLVADGGLLMSSSSSRVSENLLRLLLGLGSLRHVLMAVEFLLGQVDSDLQHRLGPSEKRPRVSSSNDNRPAATASEEFPSTKFPISSSTKYVPATANGARIGSFVCEWEELMLHYRRALLRLGTHEHFTAVTACAEWSGSYMHIQDSVSFPASPCFPSSSTFHTPQREGRNSNMNAEARIVWQYIDPISGWMPYPIAVSEHLEESLAAGVSLASLSVFDLPVQVSLSLMQEIAMPAGSVRAVRRFRTPSAASVVSSNNVASNHKYVDLPSRCLI